MADFFLSSKLSKNFCQQISGTVTGAKFASLYASCFMDLSKTEFLNE